MTNLIPIKDSSKDKFNFLYWKWIKIPWVLHHILRSINLLGFINPPLTDRIERKWSRVRFRLVLLQLNASYQQYCNNDTTKPRSYPTGTLRFIRNAHLTSCKWARRQQSGFATRLISFISSSTACLMCLLCSLDCPPRLRLLPFGSNLKPTR